MLQFWAVTPPTHVHLDLSQRCAIQAPILALSAIYVCDPSHRSIGNWQHHNTHLVVGIVNSNSNVRTRFVRRMYRYTAFAFVCSGASQILQRMDHPHIVVRWATAPPFLAYAAVDPVLCNEFWSGPAEWCRALHSAGPTVLWISLRDVLCTVKSLRHAIRGTAKVNNRK